MKMFKIKFNEIFFIKVLSLCLQESEREYRLYKFSEVEDNTVIFKIVFELPVCNVALIDWYLFNACNFCFSI